MTTPFNLTVPGAAHVINGNANSLPLPDGSVDLIVTSPPYFALRDYKDGDESLEGQIGAEATPTEFLEALWVCAQEWWRVLAPGGSLWVNLGDKYGNKSLLGLPWRFAIGMTDGKGDLDGTGWILRAEVIWSKPNGLPESVRDRVRRSHEQWFHFTKSERYYSAVDLIREPYKDSSTERAAYKQTSSAKARMTMPGEARETANQTWQPSALGALPGSVWTIATEPLKVPADLGIDHFAAYPTEWPRRIILGWAPTKGVCLTCGEGLRPAKTTSWICACDTPGPTRPAVVLDPFGGTGTTAAVAKALGCVGISNDLSKAYCKLARWRTNGDGYEKVRAKVLKEKPKAKPASQQPALLDT